MKKQTLLLVLAMAFGFALNINATKLYADLDKSVKGGNGAYDQTTHVFTWVASSNNRMVLSGLKGDLSTYTSLKLSTSDYTASYRVDIIAGGNTYTGDNSIGNRFYSAGDKTIDLSKLVTNADDLKNVTEVRINANSGSGSITINSVYLEKPMALEFNSIGQATIDLTDLTATGATYNDQTGVITSTGSGSLSVSLPDGGIDMSNVQSIKVSYEGDDIFNTLKIGSEAGSQTWYGSKYNATIPGNEKAVTAVSQNITTFQFGISKSGTETIKSITITLNPISSPEISKYGYATFCPAYDVDLTGVEGIEAYTATINGSAVQLTSITEIPAGTGVILKSTDGGAAAAATLPYASAPLAAFSGDNDLVGTLEDIASLSSKDDGYAYYILNPDPTDVDNIEKFGFYLANSQSVAAGKAYLKVANSETPASGIRLINTATAIDHVSAQPVSAASSQAYNLAGQRVNANTRGIVIINGKKYFNKQ